MRDTTQGLRPRLPAASGLALTLALTAAPLAAVPPGAVEPLLEAHAHNDYRHSRPLLDALAHGFTSVEADIFLSGGELLVGHERSELRPERTLESLYLRPLEERVRRGGGRVYRGGPQLTLLIDIKSEAEETYAALHRLLARYEEILTTVDGGQVKERAVLAVVSGNRPREALAAQALRYAGLDGRLSDLDSDVPAHLMPLLSDRWPSQFSWRGEGAFPEKERTKLAEIARKAHATGRRVRFWATPEKPALWAALLEAGVDLINTDDLAGLEGFLRERDRAGEVSLPAPRRQGPVSIEEALWGRHSTRRFAPAPLTAAELGQVLFAARGVNRPEEGKTTSPSAFEAYAVSVYVVKSDGVYRYLPVRHSLRPLPAAQGKDLRAAVVTQKEFAEAPVLLVLVADLARYPERVEPERRALWANGECGTIGQNVYLQAEALGLATVFAAAVNWNSAKEALGLGEQEMPYYVLPVGRAREEER